MYISFSIITIIRIIIICFSVEIKIEMPDLYYSQIILPIISSLVVSFYYSSLKNSFKIFLISMLQCHIPYAKYLELSENRLSDAELRYAIQL